MSVLVAAACAACSAGIVTPPAAPTATVQSVTVTGVAAAVTTGQSGALVATATMSDGSTSVVTAQATWECTNPSVATVTAAGAVNFITAGEIDLKATYKGVVGFMHVKVSAPVVVPTVTSVAVTGIGGSATAGQTSQLVATANFSDASSLNVTNTATWDTSNATVATVSSVGLVRFLAAGAVDIKATYNAVSGTAHITVAAAPVVPPPPPPPPAIDVTAFYGSFDGSLTITDQVCKDSQGDYSVKMGPTARLVLGGNMDGSSFTAVMNDVSTPGVSRTYFGQMATDGSFSGSTNGLVLVPGAFGRIDLLHDGRGVISGKVINRNMNAAENITYNLPCPGGFVKTTFSGAK